MVTTDHSRPDRSPLLSFLLAALPALVLAVVAVFYLRHEAYLAEREIRDFAVDLAADQVRSLNENLRSTTDSPEARQQAVLRDTVEWDEVPEPVGDGQDIFKALSAPGSSDAPDAALIGLSRNAHEETTTSGLPLGPIVEYRRALAAFEAGDREKGISHFIGCLADAVRSRPSSITDILLEKIESVAIREECVQEISLPQRKEQNKVWTRTRKLLRGDSSETGGETYFPLAIRDSEDIVIALSQSELAEIAEHVVKNHGPRLARSPLPLAVAVGFAGENVFSPVADTAGPLLASAGGDEAFLVSVYAVTPTAMGEAVRKKLVVHGAFLAAVLAALCFGLWQTWRTMEMQRALNRQQANLISSISHELRSPVAGIRLMAERLREAPGEDTERYPLLIEREAGRLGSLIGNVLDIGRISESKKRYVFEPTDIRELIRDSVDRAGVLAARKNVTVGFVCGGDVPPGPTVDAVAIQQAVGNLIDNAVKYSPDGAEVEVALEKCERGSGFAVKVTDRGPGIEPREQSKIFDLFYRSGSELNRETTGTGIGLHLVREIAAAHGGSVAVESEPGEGSIFTLEIPEREIP